MCDRSRFSDVAARGVSACLALSCAAVGCAGTTYYDHLAGVPLGAAPYFHHNDVLVEGSDVWVGVDPGRYPSLVGQSYRIYVVAHKDADAWNANPTLVDVSGAHETATLTAGTIADNQTRAWQDARLPPLSHRFHAHYDVVFDFDQDGQWSPGDDILDRFGVLERLELGVEDSGGFTLVRDPALPGDFPVGVHQYDFGSFSIEVPEEYDDDWKEKVSMEGVVYYPAKAEGEEQPVSTDLASYPLLIVAHGRHDGASDSFLGYEYLGRHLASRGIVCASIQLSELVDGWNIHDRGVVILEHISRLTAPQLDDAAKKDALVVVLSERLDNNHVGILGHSRGGEGGLAAQEIWSELANPAFRIAAVATFSPTDGDKFRESKELGSGPYDPVVPFLMIYGTHDSDLSGVGGNTGFRTHDRGVRPRTAVALYGGNHNFFNQKWDAEETQNPPTLERGEQETLAKALVTPFFSDHLLGQQAYAELLSGYVTPPSIASIDETVLFSNQPQRLIQRTIDDSEDVPLGWDTNSMDATNTKSDVDANEESLRYRVVPARNYYPHDTRGQRVSWAPPEVLAQGTANAGLVYGASASFGLGRVNARLFEYLSLRVGQRYRVYGSNKNPQGMSQSFSVRLVDTQGFASPLIAVDTYLPIPFTSPAAEPVYMKSIMQTVRIPLRAFTANGSRLDLGSVARIELIFDRVLLGELIFDDIELLGLDLSRPEH